MNKLLRWMPALFWAGGIYLLSGWSSPPRLNQHAPFADKAVHWVLFCVQSWLIAWALRRNHNLTLPKTILLAIICGSAYGALDEFHQRFVPNRTCDVMDWIADTLGASAAAAAFYAYESHRSAKANRQPA